MNFVVAHREGDEGYGLFHAKFRADVIHGAGGRVPNENAHSHGLIALAMYHHYVKRGAGQVSVARIPARGATREIHTLIIIGIEHEIAPQGNFQSYALSFFEGRRQGYTEAALPLLLKVFQGLAIRQLCALYKKLFLSPLRLIGGQAFPQGKRDQSKAIDS